VRRLEADEADRLRYVIQFPRRATVAPRVAFASYGPLRTVGGYRASLWSWGPSETPTAPGYDD
jgi:hypothetical protein